jgi:hypothetical protein
MGPQTSRSAPGITGHTRTGRNLPLYLVDGQFPQVMMVARAGVEPATFRISGGQAFTHQNASDLLFHMAVHSAQAHRTAIRP